MTRTRKLPLLPGDVSDTRHDVQVASYQGKRPYQEDRFAVKKFETPDAKAFLADIFKKAAVATEPLVEGSTATGVILDKNLQLTAAFLGDSPVVLLVCDPKTGDITATQITKDHHPGDPAERARIIREGGLIDEDDRLLGLSRDRKMLHSLAVSRAFGDDAMRALSREPEFVTADLKKEIDAGREVYVLVSSDGLYDRSRPIDYVMPLQDAIDNGKEDSLAEIFAAHAHKRGSRDNITALVYKVTKGTEGGLFLAIADGHGGDRASQKVIETFDAATDPRKPKPKTAPVI